MSPLLFVTQNRNKLEDARKLMIGFQPDQLDIDIPEIQSLDIEEIIRHKLRYAYNIAQKPCFVMDASVSFEALNGFPGPLIRWFHESVGEEKICRIAHHLNNPRCLWTSMLGYFDGKQEHYLSEKVAGVVPASPRGENGYNWDTIFIPENENKTLAEMTFDEKQQFAPTKKLLISLRSMLISAMSKPVY